MIALSTIAGSLWLLSTARQLASSLAVAALIAYLLRPVAERLARIPRVTRDASVIVVYGLFLVLSIALPASAAPILTERFERIVEELNRLAAQARALDDRPIMLGELTLVPEGWIRSVITPVSDTLPSGLETGVALVSGIGNNVIWILVVLVSVFYLLRDGPRLRDWFLGLLPEPWHGDAGDLLHQIDRVWRRYLRGQLILGLIVGILTTLLLTLVGLEEALLIGVIAGIFDLVPSLGPIVAGLIATVVAFFSGSTQLPLSNLWFAVLVAAIFLLIQQVENIWLRPQILGRGLRLHPGIVFVGVFGALATFGVLGALLIVPVIGSIAVLARYAHPRMLAHPPMSQLQKGGSAGPYDQAKDGGRPG